MSPQPILYVFSGLPGTGKTTLLQLLARRVGASYIRIDTIEQALRDLLSIEVHGEGYDLADRIASENLRVGTSVVADSCNLITLTWQAWAKVAQESQARCVNIEVVCSDATEHRRSVESRVTTVPNLQPPNWSEVIAREYDAWVEDRIVVDTAGRDALAVLRSYFAECGEELRTHGHHAERIKHSPHPPTEVNRVS